MARLVNTTFFAEEALRDELLRWLRTEYVEAMGSGGIFATPLLLEITASQEPGTVSFAVQAVADDDEKAAEWSECAGAQFACDIAARWSGRVLSFTTIMNVIDK